MQPIVGRNIYAAVKPEGTFGTAESSVTSSDFNVKWREISITPSINQYDTPVATGRFTRNQSIPGLRRAEFSGIVDMRPGATSGSEPTMAKVLKFCGGLSQIAITFSADLITGNKINGKINGASISEVTFSTDHVTTMGLLKSAVETAGGVGTVATVGGANNRTLYVTHPTTLMSATEFAVTDGASQATVAMTWEVTPNKSQNAANATIWFYFPPPTGNALIYKVHGAIGNAVITLSNAGEPLHAVISGVGGLIENVDGANLTMTGADSSNPPSTLGASCTHNSVTQRIGSMELDFGNEYDLKVDMGSANGTGYLGGYIHQRNPVLRASPQMSLLAADPVWTRWSAGTEAEFKLVTATSNGIRFEVSAPKAQIIAATPGDRNGETIFDQEMELHEANGNDEWKIATVQAS